MGAALTAREGNDEGAADRPPLSKATMRAPRPKRDLVEFVSPSGRRTVFFELGKP